MKKKGLFFSFLLFIFCSFNLLAENFPQKASKVEDFIPKGWKSIIVKKGDLNKDKIDDVVLLIQKNDPKNFRNAESGYMYMPIENANFNPIIMLVLLKDNDSQYNLVAKNDKAHVKLSEMIANKDVKRKYYALVHGSIKHDYGTIDAPIARNPKERKEMAIIDEGKPSITHFKVIERFEKYTLIECELETGRTHQIRVHMKYINHPLVGDPVYGLRKTINANGQALHSKSIEFNHPITGEHLYFETPIPQYMIDIMAKLDK